MNELFSYISSHFLESLIVVLLALLFAKEALIGWISALIGVKPQGQKVAEDVAHLRTHYNDDITAVLTEIQVGQRALTEMFHGFESTQVQQCTKLEEMRDILRDISRNGSRIRR